jgi:Nucleotidyl transferase of unknown function (DUF2204)
MEEQQVPWYLFGAQAAIVWGSPRYSADVDITVSLEREALPSLIATLKERGFDVVFDDEEFVDRTRVIPFRHRPTRIRLDVVLAGPGLEEEFLQRCLGTEMKGKTIPVISPEDLIILKTLAGRAKDIEDIKGVLGVRRATLDVERVRTILRLLEKALDQGDLLPLFEKAWEDTSDPEILLTSKRKKKP